MNALIKFNPSVIETLNVTIFKINVVKHVSRIGIEDFINYNYLLTSEVLPNEENLKLLNPEIKNNYNLYKVVEDFQEQTGMDIFNSYLEDIDKYKKK